jgi:hypothetical protein
LVGLGTAGLGVAADTPADQGIAALADVGLDRQVEIAGFMDQAADFLAAWVTSTNSTCWRGGMYGTPYVNWCHAMDH